MENPQSGVKGINWHILHQAWLVHLKINGKQLSQYFKPKDSTPELVERARLAAVESRRKLEEKYFTIKQTWAPLHLCDEQRTNSVVVAKANLMG